MKRSKQRTLWGLVFLLAAAGIVSWTALSVPRWSGQAPAALPYLVQQVGFANSAARIRLAGTLTLPRGGGPHPAVVLIPGQGEVDRDGAMLGHRFYEVLADDLTRRGFAVLRSDKRGIGASGGSFTRATSYDFASDIQAALVFLHRRPEVDARRIGLVGHSEGALVGAIVAGREKQLAFLVLMAGNGVPAGEMLLSRVAAGRERTLLKEVFSAVQAPGRETAVRALQARFSEEELAPYLTPWMRTLLSIDPQAVLRQVRCPVLALIGDKDLVVRADANIPALTQALAANSYARVERLPGLNHFFQTARTGEFSEVEGIRETMSPRALELIGNWALQQPAR